MVLLLTNLRLASSRVLAKRTSGLEPNKSILLKNLSLKMLDKKLKISRLAKVEAKLLLQRFQSVKRLSD